MEHMRCNIMVRMADPSGRPVVEGRALPVAECDLWAFFASRSLHENGPSTASRCEKWIALSEDSIVE